MNILIEDNRIRNFLGAMDITTPLQGGWLVQGILHRYFAHLKIKLEEGSITGSELRQLKAYKGE